MARDIALTNGMTALVDDEDFEKLSAFKWLYDGRYAYRTYNKNGKRVGVYMHNDIMQPPPGFEVDHRKSEDSLNNTRQNLRLATHQENMRNRKKSKHSSQPYKGIHFCSHGKKNWCAIITMCGIKLHTGCYQTAEEAALVYNQIATALFGEFARINVGLEDTYPFLFASKAVTGLILRMQRRGWRYDHETETLHAGERQTKLPSLKAWWPK